MTMATNHVITPFHVEMVTDRGGVTCCCTIDDRADAIADCNRRARTTDHVDVSFQVTHGGRVIVHGPVRRGAGV